MKKILSLVLALCAITAFACQYPIVIETEYGYMRHLYIAGVNSVNNHIEAVTESSETWEWSGESGGESISGVGTTNYLNFTCRNNITVDLPLTVYVAATPRTLLGQEENRSDANIYKNVLDSAKLTLSLQYRVLPSTTWITVKDISLTSWQVNLMATTGKPLFGSYVINPNASYGSTIMIRLYITAENTISGNSGVTGGYYEHIVCPTENADPGHTIAESLPDTVTCKVPVEESTGYLTRINNSLNLFGFDSHIASSDASITSRIGETGWTYEQVMTVTVSGKRRPGK